MPRSAGWRRSQPRSWSLLSKRAPSGGSEKRQVVDADRFVRCSFEPRPPPGSLGICIPPCCYAMHRSTVHGHAGGCADLHQLRGLLVYPLQPALEVCLARQGVRFTPVALRARQIAADAGRSVRLASRGMVEEALPNVAGMRPFSRWAPAQAAAVSMAKAYPSTIDPHLRGPQHG